jgi:hypothetical protein
MLPRRLGRRGRVAGTLLSAPLRARVMTYLPVSESLNLTNMTKCHFRVCKGTAKFMAVFGVPYATRRSARKGQVGYLVGDR